MKKIKLIHKILIALVSGIIAGLILGEKVAYFTFLGDIFLNLIQMSIAVFILCSVIEAVGEINPKELGKIGIKVAFWFIITTVIAGAIGLLLGNLIKPGIGLVVANLAEIPETTLPSFSELIVSFFPKNIIRALAEGEMIQIIVFALFFGVALGKLIHLQKTQDNTGPRMILNFIKNLNKTLIEMVQAIMNLAPIGVFALIAKVTGEIGIAVIIPLAKFLGTFAIGTFIFILLAYLVTALYVGISPLLLVKKFMSLTMLAITTTSSAICFPAQIDDSRNKLGISEKITNLVVPLGMALNSNGLAMFLSLACVTITQFYGVDLSIVEQIRIVVLATFACLGTVVVPGGGLVALAIVLPAMGLPLEAIALLAGIDWFSGMFRTVLNVNTDVLVTLLIAKDEKEIDEAILRKE